MIGYVTLGTNDLPRAYTPELQRQKCPAVFERVCESDLEGDVGVCAAEG